MSSPNPPSDTDSNYASPDSSISDSESVYSAATDSDGIRGDPVSTSNSTLDFYQKKVTVTGQRIPVKKRKRGQSKFVFRKTRKSSTTEIETSKVPPKIMRPNKRRRKDPIDRPFHPDAGANGPVIRFRTIQHCRQNARAINAIAGPSNAIAGPSNAIAGPSNALQVIRFTGNGTLRDPFCYMSDADDDVDAAMNQLLDFDSDVDSAESSESDDDDNSDEEDTDEA